MIKLITLMSSAAIAGKILAVPASIVTARFLGPSLLGVLAVVDLARKYVGYSQLGFLQSLSRDVPIAQGRNDTQDAQIITDSVFTAFTLLGSIAIAVVVIMIFAGVGFDGVLTRRILPYLVCLFIATLACFFMRHYLKAYGEFIAIGKGDLVVKTVTPLITIPAVIMWNIYGALAAMLASEVIWLTCVFVSVGLPHVHFALPLRKTLVLLKTGFMMFMNKMADSIFWSVDLLIIAAMMTTYEVGIYKIALSAMVMTDAFTQGLSMTIYRKIMIDGGKHGTGNREAFEKYIGGVYIIYMLATTLILGAGMLFYVLLVHLFLDKYLASLPVMFILAVGYTVFSARRFPSFYMNVTNQLARRLFIICAGLGVNIVFDMWAIANGFGIVGVAAACSASFVLIAGWIVVFSVKQIGRSTLQAFSLFGRICLVTACSMGLAGLCMKWRLFGYLHESALPARIMMECGDFVTKALLFGVFTVGCYLLVFRSYRIQNEFRPIIKLVLGRLLRKSTVLGRA